MHRSRNQSTETGLPSGFSIVVSKWLCEDSETVSAFQKMLGGCLGDTDLPAGDSGAPGYSQLVQSCGTQATSVSPGPL